MEIEVKFISYDYWNNEEIAPSIDSTLAVAKEGFFNYCEIGGENQVILLFTREPLSEDIKQALKMIDINNEDEDDEEDEDSDSNDFNINHIIEAGGEFEVEGYKFKYNK